VPVHAWSLNDEKFKAAVIDLLKCTSDVNLQCNYVSDGFGDVELAGLGVPPIALTDGTSPGAELLFKHCLDALLMVSQPDVTPLLQQCLHLLIVV